MKQQIITIAAGLLIGASAAAAPLTPEQALARLKSDSSVSARIKSKAATERRPMHTVMTAGNAAAAYIFSEAGDGYLVLSADDSAYPLLGYCESGTFDADRIAPSMRWWLDEYARQIEWAQQQGAAATAPRKVAEGRRDVALSSRPAGTRMHPTTNTVRS